MARKTNKAAMVALDRFENQLKHFEEILRIKREVPVENQAAHVRDRGEDYWLGRIEGAVAQVEDALFDNKCYHGFGYIDSKGNWLTMDGLNRITEHPEFKEWRRRYFTKE